MPPPCGDSLGSWKQPRGESVSHPDVPPEYAKFFEPKRLQQNLLLGALYLATFEILKITVVDDLISFFAPVGGEYRDGKPIPTEAYRAALAKHGLRQHRDPYRASCLWLQDVEAVTAEECQKLLEVRAHRNQIAHELPAVLLDAKLEVNVSLLVEARNLIHKLDRWWFENYHAAVDPEILGGQSVNQVEFTSFRMAFIDHVMRNTVKDL
jgi:hypothetical protein